MSEYQKQEPIKAIEVVRKFNRFFTAHVGAIDDKFLGVDASLAESRVIFEIGSSSATVTARDIGAKLSLDRGYLSRIISRLIERGWIVRGAGAADSRMKPITLTEKGLAIYERLQQAQNDEVKSDLEASDSLEITDLISSLTRSRLILDKSPSRPADFSIRPFRHGEPLHLAARQAEIYTSRYGWGRQIEVVLAESATRFLKTYKENDREQCFVAEIDECLFAGGIFLTDDGDDVARIRLLHVESFASRRGIGEALVKACIEFAEAHGYKKIVLWTHTVLEAARRIYARNGFSIVSTSFHNDFETAEPLQSETWEKTLSDN